MELVSLNRRALLVPTPGQTEQEYLGEFLSSKGLFTSCPQKYLNGKHFPEPGDIAWPAELNEQSSILLEKALGELLE